jgi:hypothetical protein
MKNSSTWVKPGCHVEIRVLGFLKGPERATRNSTPYVIGVNR